MVTYDLDVVSLNAEVKSSGIKNRTSCKLVESVFNDMGVSRQSTTDVITRHFPSESHG